jgi:hypothetical protein
MILKCPQWSEHAMPEETPIVTVQPRETPRYELPAENTKRKAGRPRKIAPWFAAVAKTMADGTALQWSLIRNGISLDKAERRKLYRNKEFRRLYTIERNLYMLNEYGKRPQSEMERIRKSFERQFR